MEGSSELPPNSYLQDQIAPGPFFRTGQNAAQAAAATRAAAGGTDSGEFCSYMEDCTTGSPLRKVVSHIFGRNKLCTRQIPSGVWVHYCRKHYQRSRYRNPNGFALLQCDLVRKQIDRLQVWGGVSDWIVKIRKREEVRLSRENAELGTTDHALEGEAAVEEDEDEDDEEPQPYRTERQKRRTSAPARASAWLRQSLGEGKSTAEVLEILGRIEDEIRATGSNSFPDVEILPNVITAPAPRRNTRATPSSSPAVAARTPTPRGRNRGQSNAASTHHDSPQQRRRLSGPAAHSRSRSDSAARTRAGLRTNTNMAVGSSISSSSTTTSRLRAVSDAPPRKRKGSPPPRSSRIQTRTPPTRTELDDDRPDVLPPAGRRQATLRLPALGEGTSDATKRARRHHGPGSTPMPTTYERRGLEEEDEDYQDDEYMEEQTTMSPPSRRGRSTSALRPRNNSLQQERVRRTSFMERLRAPRRPSARAPTPAPDAMDVDVGYATSGPATERIPALPQPLPPTARPGRSSMVGEPRPGQSSMVGGLHPGRSSTVGEPHPGSLAPAGDRGDYHYYRHGSNAEVEEASFGPRSSDADDGPQVAPRAYSGERYAPFRERRGY